MDHEHGAVWTLQLGRFLFASALYGALVAVAPAAAQVGGAAEVLTLDQAIALGMQNNRSIRRAELEVARADDAVAAMRSRRGPSFDINFLESRLLADVEFNFPAGAFGSFPIIGQIPATDTKIVTEAQWVSVGWLRVVQPISQLHRIGLGVKQLELGRQGATEQLRARREAVAADLRRIYYGILQTEGGIEARERSLALHREIDRVVAQLVEERLALPSDGLQVKAAIATQEAALVKLRNALATLHEQLNASFGRDIEAPFAVSPIPEPSAGEEALDALEARARSSRPELREASIAIERARTGVRLKRAEQLPDVSAMFSFLGFGQFEVIPPATTSVGVLVTWEPFDWGRRRREAAAGEKLVEQLEGTQRDAETLVRTEVRQAYRKYGEARDALRVARMIQETAHEKLRVALVRHREQQALLRTVLEAQADLAAADQQHNDALLAVGSARADLERAVGGQ